MPKHPTGRIFALLVMFLATLLAACGQSAPPAAPPPAGDAATTAPPATGATSAAPAGDDLLAAVKARGKLIIATDANYKPQSYQNPDNSWEGFDIDVAREVAKRLGVEPEFLNISFDVITAGSWNGRWDVNVGSMTVTTGRKERLIFSTPYYYTPASFVVHKDSTVTSIAELEGKKVGVGAATTYLDYLNGVLKIEGETVRIPPPKVEVKVYDTDSPSLEDLALGNGIRIDAVVTAQPTANQAIKDGRPFKILGDPVYYELLCVALDREAPQSAQTLADEISKIVEAMHQDGTLTALSNKYYGVDYTKKK